MSQILGTIFAIICIFSFVCSIFSGNIETLSEAAINGASKAVTLTIALTGTMCLWNGIMEVLKDAGAISYLTKILRPLLRFIFPEASKKGKGLDDISAAISANILGMGNAATPLALRAMERLNENNGKSDCASDDMVMFTVIATSTFNFIPTTIIALRQAANSNDPFSIILPVWICSAAGMLAAIFFSKSMAILYKRKKK